jgi:hypothetical protein
MRRLGIVTWSPSTVSSPRARAGSSSARSRSAEAGGVRQPEEAPAVDGAQFASGGEGRGRRLRPGELARCEAAAQFQECAGVASGQVHQDGFQVLGEVVGALPEDQAARLVVQRRQRQRGDTGEAVAFGSEDVFVVRGEQDEDRLVLHSARGVGERVQGLAVEPVRVVRDAQQRAVVGEFGQGAEHVARVVRDGRQDTAETRAGQCGLRPDAGEADHPEVGRRPARRPAQQGGAPEAGAAADGQRTAVSLPGLDHQFVQ